MTTASWLKEAQRRLEHAGIPTARLDALILLEDLTGKDRAWLLSHPDAKLAKHQVQQLENLLSPRLEHMPLAYIRGRMEFYGREFLITSGVLQPRPESETMIDLLKKLPNLPVRVRVADVGCGCGALGITAALELPNSQVELLDIEPKALKLAKMNVDKFTLSCKVYESDLLQNFHQYSDVLLCNLPYVPDDFRINLAAAHEPKLAIFGGADGLNLYRKLFKQLARAAQKPLYILTEALPTQHRSLVALAEQSDYTLLSQEDFIQVFRLKNL